MKGQKHDAYGRSSTKLSRLERKLRGNAPPKEEPWIWHTRAMLESPAWRAISINGRRLLSAIELEHMAHAGTENGRLICPYSTLIDYGLTERLIPAAIKELEFLGFLAVKHGGRRTGSADSPAPLGREPNLYRLTWMAAEGLPATNDWKKRDQAAIDAWCEVGRLRASKGKKTPRNAGSRPPVVGVIKGGLAGGQK